MNQHPHVLSRLVFLSLLTLMIGCGPGETGPQRYDVTGLVTFKGAAVTVGTVVFIPDASKGNSGPQGTAHIKNGAFSTNGKGVMGGPYTVRVLGFDGETNMEEELPAGLPLFSPHEFQVDMPAIETRAGEPEIMEIEVPQGTGK